MKSSFLFELTADQSFTMRFIDPETGAKLECMHSLRGAFSETNYIYGHAIRWALENKLSHKFLSVGLGLGYCEILLTALMLQKDFYLESFEANSDLRDLFKTWILEAQCDSDFQKVYEQTAQSSAELCQTQSSLIKERLRMQLKNQNFKMSEKLESTTHFNTKFSVILFDAFSAKSSPDLWTEEFLTDFFQKTCADQCVFASYACTSTLKRSLKNSGFKLQIRPGLANKRESTFAIRLSHS